MNFNVDGWNNFCRVYELPEQYSHDYCFGGGIDTSFKMVDWFRPLCDLPTPAVDKKTWERRVGEIEVVSIDIQEFKSLLHNFLMNKIYVKPHKKYICIADFGACFMFEKEVKDGQ